jgi:hypothetical protein
VSDAPGPEARTNALGVVDQLRIPGVARARRLFLGLPRLSQIFVALAAIDIVVRGIGLFGTSLFLDLAYPLSVITAFFPHDALILLPAVIVWWRPDALEATPLVARGAIAVALAELLNAPLRGLTSGNPQDLFVAPTVIAILATIVTSAGWIAIAEGLRQLNPPKPEATAAGLANLVGGAIAVGALAQLVTVLLGPGPELGEPGWNTLASLANAILGLGGFAFAYLGRTVVAGHGDPHRPTRATNVATAALTLYAIGSLLTTLLTIAALSLPAWSDAVSAVLTGIYLLTGPVALTAFVVAFGLGLADPSGTIEPVTLETASAPGTL